MNSKNILLLIAGVLVLFGLLKPNLNNIYPTPSKSVVVVEKPTDENVLNACDAVVKALSVSSDRHTDGKRLSSLYMDISSLIELDGENSVIKNTEEIKQANSLSGLLLKLDMKGKYTDLSKATQSVIVSSIGDDIVELDDSLRAKAVKAFRALAWACEEGSK